MCVSSGVIYLVSDCTDGDDAFNVDGVESTCAEVVAKYSKFCFTWANLRDTHCCETCHRAGLSSQAQICE